MRYLQIDGTVNYTEILANDFFAAYVADGYVVTGDSTYRKAENEAKHLAVTLKQDDDGPVFKETIYDESYDKTKFVKWNDETRQTFNEYLDNHGSDIPLFYRGTSNPDFSLDDDCEQYGGVRFSSVLGKTQRNLFLLL